ncbi:hypothetical protein F5883DRAFT_439401 [Diaporthe sp. PMI_573]|nr:hypothetical protein F5883DRAFT_439401 [Diaporthaceae sp. PMI_573]
MSSTWQESLMGCCSPFGLCCEGFWCPCIVLGRTTHRLKHNGDMQKYNCCNADCGVLCALHAFGGWGWVLQCIRRGEIREKYHMEKNCCGDCMVSLCCHCCAVVRK